MGYLFDRDLDDDHAWASALDELDRRGDEHTAWSRNWRMDLRVSHDRETSMLANPTFSSRPDGPGLLAETRKHFKSELCRPFHGSPPPGYARDDNSGNRIAAFAIAPGARLIHVACLATSLFRALSAEDFDVAPAIESEIGLSLGPDRRWEALRRRADDLAPELNGRDPAEIKRFVELLCDGLGDTEPAWWATFSADITDELRLGDAMGIARALGLGHLDPGTWLIVFDYDANLVRRACGPDAFFRPTVIEAGLNPFHFPSPPGSTFGITMPLADPSRAGQGACRELLHPPLRKEAAATACTGRFLQLETEPVVARSKIGDLRCRHRQRLALEPVRGSDDPIDWLRRHEPSTTP